MAFNEAGVWVYSNNELFQKVDWEGGIDYFLNEISPEQIAHDELRELLVTMKPLSDRYNEIINSIEEEMLDY